MMKIMTSKTKKLNPSLLAMSLFGILLLVGIILWSVPAKMVYAGTACCLFCFYSNAKAKNVRAHYRKKLRQINNEKVEEENKRRQSQAELMEKFSTPIKQMIASLERLKNEENPLGDGAKQAILLRSTLRSIDANVQHLLGLTQPYTHISNDQLQVMEEKDGVSVVEAVQGNENMTSESDNFASESGSFASESNSLASESDNFKIDDEATNSSLVSSELDKLVQNVTSKGDEVLQELNRLIDENIDNPRLSVCFLANQMNMSRSSLFAKLKCLLDTTPNELIRLAKMNKAACLLKNGNYRINEVCYMVGFSSPSYFSKCFQKQFGMKPGEYIGQM